MLRIQPADCDLPRVLRFYPWDFSVHDQNAVWRALRPLAPDAKTHPVDPMPDDWEEWESEKLTVGLLGDTVIILASEKTQRQAREIFEGMKK